MQSVSATLENGFAIEHSTGYRRTQRDGRHATSEARSRQPGRCLMIDTRTAPYAALLLRVSLGVLFLAHAAVKLFVFTPAGTAEFFGSLGLPAALAYLVIAAEL